MNFQRIILFDSVFLLLLAFSSQTEALAADYYVSKSGNNSDGKSWTNAWSSFANIKWDTDGTSGPVTGVGPGDTLYISGGSPTATYTETLTVGASGSDQNNRIRIDVGANSPNPTGHNGTVIIDGGGTRGNAISIVGKKYITVNGSKGSEYKMLLQNTVGENGAVYIRSTDYVNVEYIKINNSTNRGIKVDGYNTPAKHTTIKGCEIKTGDINNDAQTDGIYTQYSEDTIIENNVVVLGNNGADHNDCFQTANGEKRLTLRNNYFEWAEDRGGSDSQVCMMEGIQEWLRFYNNVVIGSKIIPWQVCLLSTTQSGYGATMNFWNNTFVSKKSTAMPLRVQVTSNGNTINSIGSIKNNIFYSVGSVGLEADKVNSPSDINNNLYFLTTGTNVSRIGGVSRTWATHHAIYDINGLSIDPNLNTSDMYKLNSGSPAIDAGANLGTLFNTDRLGVSRPVGSAWDIGAYESKTTTTTPPTPPTVKPGDANNDGQVNETDYSIWESNYYTATTLGTEAGDFDKDGIINGVDYVIWLNNYGK